MASCTNSRRRGTLPYRWAAAVLCLALSAGCTQKATVKPSTSVSRPAPTVAPKPSPKPKPPAPPAKPAPGVSGSAKAGPAPTPAVAALMGDADKAAAAGQLDAAAATLERAIRMQPRNPELWYRLAEVRMEQNQPRLALDLARKSKVLAKGNPDLIQKSQALIDSASTQEK
ncbi:MAG: tetratricopeptide repeat protein [Methylococcus sp.]|nr:tetratricopeptide repeat protein [Methylococcus sp.]